MCLNIPYLCFLLEKGNCSNQSILFQMVKVSKCKSNIECVRPHHYESIFALPGLESPINKLLSVVKII